MERIRVLEVVAQEPTGGVGTFLTSILNNKPEDIDIDFLMSPNNQNRHKFSNMVKKISSSKIFILPRITNIFQYIKSVDEFYSTNAKNYDIVHVHAPNIFFIHGFFAKKNGVKHRILHSHNTKYSDTFIKSCRNKFLIDLGLRNATKLLAASKKAGAFLFGNDNYKVIKNGIEISNYIFNPIYRSQSSFNKDVVVGMVGNLTLQKNYQFVIEIAQHLSDFGFMIIGEGPERESLQRSIKEKHLDNIYIMGERADVNLLYNEMDIFIMPSLFEGFPLSGVEAQANGLPTIFSDCITKDICLTSNSFRLPLDVEIWYQYLKKIDKKRNEMAPYEIKKSGYDIVDTSRYLFELYRKELEN